MVSTPPSWVALPTASLAGRNITNGKEFVHVDGMVNLFIYSFSAYCIFIWLVGNCKDDGKDDN